jgi:ketosteroid isomerase-like protein
MEYYTAFMQGIESTAAEVQELVAQRDKVVVLGRHHGRIRATGKGYDLNWAQVFTVREGKIAAMHSYHDTHLVAEAARSD